MTAYLSATACVFVIFGVPLLSTIANVVVTGSPALRPADAALQLLASASSLSSSGGYRRTHHAKRNTQPSMLPLRNTEDELLSEGDHCDDWITSELSNSHFRNNLHELAKAIVRSGISKRTDLTYQYLIYCGLLGNGGSSEMSRTLRAAVEAFSTQAVKRSALRP